MYACPSVPSSRSCRASRRCASSRSGRCHRWTTTARSTATCSSVGPSLTAIAPQSARVTGSTSSGVIITGMVGNYFGASPRGAVVTRRRDDHLEWLCALLIEQGRHCVEYRPPIPVAHDDRRHVRRVGHAPKRSTRSCLRTLPVGLRGSASTSSSARGSSGASEPVSRCSARPRRRASARSCRRRARRPRSTARPARGRGAPTTATSATAGCEIQQVLDFLGARCSRPCG